MRSIAIRTGPDGALWFTDEAPYFDQLPPHIGRMTSDGLVQLFDTPSGEHGYVPQAIVVGPDDNIWFTELSAPQVGISGRIGRVRLPG